MFVSFLPRNCSRRAGLGPSGPRMRDQGPMARPGRGRYILEAPTALAGRPREPIMKHGLLYGVVGLFAVGCSGPAGVAGPQASMAAVEAARQTFPTLSPIYFE